MFGYNPQVQDRSGEILGNYQLQGAQMQQQGMNALANGMTSTGNNIASALDQMAQINRLHQQAIGTINAAKDLELIHPDQYAAAMQLPANQLIGFAQSVTPMVQAQRMGMIAQARLTGAENRSGKAISVKPWSASPGATVGNPSDSSNQ